MISGVRFGIDRAVFQDCLRTMPTLTCNRVGILSHRFRPADARIEALAMLDVEVQVARLLIAFAKNIAARTQTATW